MSTPWRAAGVGLDMATATCAAINLAYFLYRLSSPQPETPSRKLAAFVLALVSIGAMVESLFFLAWTSGLGEEPVLASARWALVRALPFAGMAGMSALVLRRVLSR